MVDYLTRNDVDAYGSELVDFAQRAPAHALSPAIQNLEQQNAELQRRLAKEARHRLDQQVEQAIPTYREIDRDAGWHQWLLGYDALSGEVRQRLLNAAIQRGDATSVIAFFKGYQRESGGAQHVAAPDRTRSAPSTRGRIYSRDEISRLYRQHELGAYNGREAEWARLEHDIIKASGEGRVLNPVDIRGK